MKQSLLLCGLCFVFFAALTYGNPSSTNPPYVATQVEIDNDSFEFLASTARNLEKSDIILVVIIYKIVETDQGTAIYARVIQSLRGEIPVEALVMWNGQANRLPAGTPPKTTLISGDMPVYVLASSKNMKKLPETPEDFAPAESLYGMDAYDLNHIVSYFPMTESDPGRAMKKLLHIEPAKITAESEAARFKPESDK